MKVIKNFAGNVAEQQLLLHVGERLVVRVVLVGLEVVDVDVCQVFCLLGGGGGNHPAVSQHLWLQGGSLGLSEGSAHHGLAQRTEGGTLQ